MNPEQLSYPIGAAVGTAALIYKLRHLRKDPNNPVLRALCVTLGFASFAFLAAMPDIYVPVSNALGLDNLGKLVVHGSLIAFSICVQRMLLAWMYPPEVAKRKGRQRVIAGAVVLTTMVGLLALAPISGNGTSENFARDYATTPYVAEYLLIYVTAVGAGVAEIARLCWRFAKVAGRPWLVRGLRLTATGALINLGYSSLRGVYVIGRNVGVDLEIAYNSAPVFATVGSVLVFVGLVLPALGPQLSIAYRWLQRLRAYHQLFPLWLALYEAFPDIALHPPANPRLERWRISALDYRLHRLVTEIRDGRHELRERFDAQLLNAQQELVGRPGQANAQRRAAVEAAMIRQALNAPTPIAANTPGDSSRSLSPLGGSDYEGEKAWFLQVSQAFTKIARDLPRAHATALPDPSNTAHVSRGSS